MTGLAATRRSKRTRIVVMVKSWVMISHSRPSGIGLERGVQRLDGVH